MIQPRQLGVYLQVPFCEAKCTFCNFSSRVGRPSDLVRYTQALGQEISHLPEFYRARGLSTDVLSVPVDTIYFGGGTPTLLGEEGLAEVVGALRAAFLADAVEEFTIELTPGSAGEPLLQAMRKLGINRLSLGAQTFNDRELRAVGRLHSAEEITSQVRLAGRAGFTNISLDLIAGLPYQTEASWRKTVECALQAAPAHVSVYLYELDEHSRLGQEALRQGTRYHAEQLPGDDFAAWAYEWAREQLAAAGYAHYEISNFALPGFESRHNLKYWRLQPYVGVGAGAHSFDGERRWSNHGEVAQYESCLESGEPPLAQVRRLSLSEQVEEFFFLGLRRREGIDLTEATERWGAGALQPWRRTLEALISDGWLERANSRVRLSPPAVLVSNEIFQEFITA